eukprot:5973559-Pyramimonas_sp.AAC.1
MVAARRASEGRRWGAKLHAFRVPELPRGKAIWPLGLEPHPHPRGSAEGRDNASSRASRPARQRAVVCVGNSAPPRRSPHLVAPPLPRPSCPCRA